MNQLLKRCCVFFVTAFTLSVTAFSQVTTSSFNGFIVDSDGQPVPGAVVAATHTPSGTSYFAAANNEGRVAINGMRAGGPYSVEVSCLGYQTVTYTDITLKLAETYTLRATLSEDTELLSEAIVISTTSSKFITEQSGVATNIRNEQITAMPNISRSIADFTRLSPYGGNGMSIAGTDGRTANFTVDGANFNNNFGLSENLPGGGTPISIDAIEEMQLVVSPFDIRQTNFIGGGLNAITKSGTNQFKGSAYVYHTNEFLRGDTVDGTQLSGVRDKDRNTTFGVTLGGPIVKNKLFFFVNFDYSIIPTVVDRWKASDDGVADASSYIARPSKSDMQKVYDHLMNNYSYDAGSYTNYPANTTNMKLLARIDWNINDKNHLALRYNYTLNKQTNPTNASSSDASVRAKASRVSEYSMIFSNSVYYYNNIVHTVSLDLNSNISDRVSNQLLATFSILDDTRDTPSSKFPFIDILDGTGEYYPYISAGYELFSWNNAVHNRVVTVKDDVSYLAGNHKLTFGLNYEYQMADNSYMRNGTGYYRYNSLDDFLNQAAPETVALTYGYGGETNPAARVTYHKASIYAQDEWDVSPRVSLIGGLRLETMFFDNKDLMTNNAILGMTGGDVSGTEYTYRPVDYAGPMIDTGYWPKANPMLLPRIGVNWDTLGDKSLIVRGGTGLFAGRIPLVYFTNMPTNGGMVQNRVQFSTGMYQDANGKDYTDYFAGPLITDTKEFIEKLNSINSSKYPIDITPEDGVLPDEIQAVDRHYKMPKVWKTSIALDYNFKTSFPMTVTGEFIYNKSINSTYLQDLSRKEVTSYSQYSGADNRYIYPSEIKYKYVEIASDGTQTTYNMPSIYYLTNNNKGYGYTASIQFKMQPWKWFDFSAAYTHTVSKEYTGMPGSDASSSFVSLPTIQGPNNPTLHNSSYVIPDRIFASLNLSDKSGNHFNFFYEAWRGGYNYTYMATNDINGDGNENDVIYIPTEKQISSGQFRFVQTDADGNATDDAARFMAFVNNDKYLSKHKGKYAEPYSVYSPWVHRVDFRYSHDFKIKAGNSMNILQLNIDFKNILNLFDSSWGVMKYMNPDLKEGRILTLDHVDSDNVPVYSTPDYVNGNTKVWTYYSAISQCWSIQVGVKYMFN